MPLEKMRANGRPCLSDNRFEALRSPHCHKWTSMTPSRLLVFQLRLKGQSDTSHCVTGVPELLTEVVQVRTQYSLFTLLTTTNRASIFSSCVQHTAPPVCRHGVIATKCAGAATTAGQTVCAVDQVGEGSEIYRIDKVYTFTGTCSSG